MPTTKKRREVADRVIKRMIAASDKSEAEQAADRQRREDERIRQILSATGHNYLSDEVRAKLLAILSDVAVNGI